MESGKRFLKNLDFVSNCSTHALACGLPRMQQTYLSNLPKASRRSSESSKWR